MGVGGGMSATIDCHLSNFRAVKVVSLSSTLSVIFEILVGSEVGVDNGQILL